MDKITLLNKAKEFSRSFDQESNLCIICGTSIETQGHHIYPIHLGGPKDGPLVSICSAHHLLVHHLTGKKSDIPPDFNVNQIKIIKMLVSFIRLAQVVYEELDPTLIDRKLIVVLPHGLLKRAHARKLDCGYSNLNDYVLSLITQDVMKL